MWLCAQSVSESLSVQSESLDGNNENDACGGLHLQSIMFLTTPSLGQELVEGRFGREWPHLREV
jgi:hypothetical protein